MYASSRSPGASFDSNAQFFVPGILLALLEHVLPKRVHGRRWVGLSPERVGTELADLHARYGFDDVNFQDETYFTYADRVAEIAEQILRQGLKISWAATMRADQGDRLPEEVMALCRRSGLRRLIIGVEEDQLRGGGGEPRLEARQSREDRDR